VLLECTRQLGILTRAAKEDSSKKTEIRKAKKTLQDLDSSLKDIMDINSYLTVCSKIIIPSLMPCLVS